MTDEFGLEIDSSEAYEGQLEELLDRLEAEEVGGYSSELTSSGTPRPGVITGTSSTKRPVTDTTQVPFRWVCRIDAMTQTKTHTAHSIGTGVLISPWHVLTCAHVIYPPQDLYQTLRVVVSPGYSAASKPAFEANGWAVCQRWNPRECVTSTYFDYGLIRLAKPVGSATGFWRNWLPLPTAPTLPGKPCKLAGYAPAQMFQSDGRLKAAAQITNCRPTRTSPSGGIVESDISFLTVPVTQYSILILHDADSTKSMSGGPIWIDNGDSPKLVAIHAGATCTDRVHHCANGSGIIRRAVLFSQAVQFDIHQWMNGSLRPLP